MWLEEKIRDLDEFFKIFIEDGFGRFVFCHLPFWTLVYHLLWAIIAYLLPYVFFGVLVLSAPVMAGKILYRCFCYDPLKNRFKKALTLSILIEIALVGIPGVWLGFFFQIWKTKPVLEIYHGAIYGWWSVFNALNHFADRSIPYENYNFNLIHLQWGFWLVGICGTWIVFNKVKTDSDHQLLREEIQARKIQEELRVQKELDENRRAREEARRKKLEDQERQRQALEEEKKRRFAEVTAKNPWDSGFL